MQIISRKGAWAIDPLLDFYDKVDIAQGRAEALGLAVQRRGGALGD
jgi:hypothetical protein